MDQLEALLVQFPRLRSLRLEISGENDLLNGSRWQNLTTTLKVFHFKFYLLDVPPFDPLQSFATPYWLEEKRWFVSYNGEDLFSIPDFVPDHINLPGRSCLRSTAADVTHICDQVTELTLDSAFPANVHRFPILTSLKLNVSLSAAACASLVDIHRLVRLSVLSLDDLRHFFPLKSRLPRLIDLQIGQPLNIESMTRFRGHRLEQIRRLHLVGIGSDADYLVEELLRLFPSLTNLSYISRELTMRVMLRLVDRLKKLSKAVFSTDVSFAANETSFCRRPEDFLHALRWTKWTCQVQHTINSRLPIIISWTIEPQVRRRFLKEQTFEFLSRYRQLREGHAGYQSEATIGTGRGT